MQALCNIHCGEEKRAWFQVPRLSINCGEEKIAWFQVPMQALYQLWGGKDSLVSMLAHGLNLTFFSCAILLVLCELNYHHIHTHTHTHTLKGRLLQYTG